MNNNFGIFPGRKTILNNTLMLILMGENREKRLQPLEKCTTYSKHMIQCTYNDQNMMSNNY